MAQIQFPRDTIAYAWTVASAIVLGLFATLLSAITDSQALIAKLAIGNLSEFQRLALQNQSAIEVEGNFAFAAAIWFLLLLLVAFGVMAVRRSQDEAALKAKLNNRDPLFESAVSDFNHIVGAADQVFAELFPKDISKLKFRRIQEVIDVGADGTAQVERTYEIEAGTEEARAWRCTILADDTADEVILPSQIALKARGLGHRSGERLHHLVTGNAPKEKEVLVVFSPPIQPGEQRHFRITYTWNGFARDIATSGKSLFHVNYRTCHPQDEAHILYEMRFSKSLGSIACASKADLLGGTLVEDHSTDRWVWRYENRSMRMHGAVLQFEAKATDNPAA